MAAALAAVVVCITGGVARADTITVNTTGDPVEGSCPDACSLRHAVASALDGDTISLPAATYAIGQGAPIEVTHAIAIAGAGAGSTIVDGSGNTDGNAQHNRIFNVDSGATLDLAAVTLSGGQAETDETCLFGCWTLAATGGGALLNADGATTRLSHVKFTGNWARVGGAVATAGTLSLADVDFQGDDAAFGGGLFVRGGSVSAQRVAFHDAGRTAYGGGAAFVLAGALTLRDSTVTASGGAETPGGAVENYGGALTLVSDTLAGNRHGSLMTDQGAGVVTTVENTIIGTEGDGDPGCTPVGRYTGSDVSSDRAITVDAGHNIDQGGECLLDQPGDLSGVDPKLAPLADNGGATPTRALLHGSPALDAAEGDDCSLADQRGVSRSQDAGCDIGAFEAVRLAAPSVTTAPATDVATDSATLHADADLAGEAGGVRFELGTAADALSPAGFAPALRTGDVTFAATGLQPHTTYYFRAVAENATAASAPGAVESFTTASGPPAVSDASAHQIDDSTATITFTLDTGGADTHYVIVYGGDDTYGQTTPSIDAGAATGAHTVTYTLTALDPDSTYHFDVVAESAVAPDGVHSGDSQFHTDRQVSGTRGALLTFTDSGDDDTCPRADGITIDWGDGSQSQAETVSCTPGNEHGLHYVITAQHTYTQTGHFLIRADYGAMGVSHAWALVSPPEQHSLSVTFAGSGTGSVSGDGVHCPASCLGVYDTGTVVTLQATPAAGSRFAGWDGACTGTTPCTVTLDRHRDVTARFALLPPAISDVRVDATTDSTATISFTADPGGAVAHYAVLYGPSASYGQSDAFDLPAAGGPRRVTRTLRGLAPAAQYHFDVVATSAVAPAGVHSGDGTFTTPQRQVEAATPPPTPTTPSVTPPAPPAPGFGRTVVVRPLSGTLRVRATGERNFVPLTAETSLPLGSRVDATRGRVTVTALNRAGGTPQTVTAYGGVFTVKRAGKVTDLVLSGPLPRCSGKPAGRGLWADGVGGFRISGRYASATGRAAKWQVSDGCSATTTRVARGTAAVTDSLRHKQLTLKAGHRYVARRGH